MSQCPICFHAYKSADKHCNYCGKLLPEKPTNNAQGTLNMADGQLQAKILEYDLVENIEMGDYCPAYFVEKNGERYLLKKMVLDPQLDEKIKSILANESETLKKINSSAFPENFDFVLESDALYSIYSSVFGKRVIDFILPEKITDIPKIPELNRAIRWARQLAEAIAYLHHLRPFPIVHRNINPYTVLITQSSDNVRFLDFGLLNTYRMAAETVSQDQSIIQPSRFSNSNLLREGWSDTRTDVYAFGRFLDFLLTGVIPEHSDSHPALLKKDLKLDSKVLERISNIVNRSLKTFEEDGYKSIDELIVDLEHVLSSVTSLGSTSTPCVCGYLNLESARLCLKCGRLLHAKVAGKIVDTNLVQFDDSTFDKITQNLRHGKVAPLQRYRLRESLDSVQTTPGFDELISLDELPLVEKMPHQKDAALTTLKLMRGRALLADEVGLGKTIEAGMVLKELIRRSLASKILILCPIQLRSQWQAELYQKFNEIFLILDRDIQTPLSWFTDHLIVSYSSIVDPFHREILLSQTYDLVILDEAHNLNLAENSEILQVIKNLQKKYFLLLSATPMHNSLDELYNIITLLRPGHFDDAGKFRDEFVDPETSRPKQESVERLRRSLHEVMIRHSREQVRRDYHFPERNPQTWSLTLSNEARAYYEKFRNFYKHGVSDITNPRVLELLNSIVEKLCSSKRAFGDSISNLKFNKVIQRQFRGSNFLVELEAFRVRYPDSLISPKLDKLEEILTDENMRRERVLVFSQYQETASFIFERLRNDYPDLRERLKLYNEKSSPAERDKIIEQFRNQNNAILVCPGEASEGLNLQICSFMINFDLPWDPMKLEQRIGRIQRIGGKHKINIINLVLSNTIESDILNILQEKIKIFEAVVGQVESIIGNIQDEVDIPTIIGNIFMDRQMELVEHTAHSAGAPVYDESLLEAVDEDELVQEKQVSPIEYLDIKLQQPAESNLMNDIFFDEDALNEI